MIEVVVGRSTTRLIIGISNNHNFITLSVIEVVVGRSTTRLSSAGIRPSSVRYVRSTNSGATCAVADYHVITLDYQVITM